MHIDLNPNVVKGLHRIARQKGYAAADSPQADLWQWLAQVPKRHAEHQIAWTLARNLRLFDLGGMGYYLYACPNMAEAWADMAELRGVVIRPLELELAEAPDGLLRWALSTAAPRSSNWARQGRILALVDVIYRHSIVCKLTYRHFKPKRISLMFEADKACLAFLSRKMGCPVDAAADASNCIFYEKELLEAPIPSGNPEVRRHLHRLLRLEWQERMNAGNLGGTLSRMIKTQMGKGGVSLADAAKMMGTTPRKMQRQLKREGTTYARILESCRRDQSRRYIAEGLGNEAIADLLGYTEVNSFIRAFRRWFGMGIGDYRKQRIK